MRKNVREAAAPYAAAEVVCDIPIYFGQHRTKTAPRALCGAALDVIISLLIEKVNSIYQDALSLYAPNFLFVCGEVDFFYKPTAVASAVSSTHCAYQKFTSFSLDLLAGLMYNIQCMIMRTLIGGVFVIDPSERQERIAELSEKYKSRVLEQAISRVKAEMSSEIAGFAQKYEFADSDTSERLKKLIDELPCGHDGFDFDKLPAHRAFSVKGVDTRKKTAYLCSLVGSEEIFETFVKEARRSELSSQIRRRA